MSLINLFLSLRTIIWFPQTLKDRIAICKQSEKNIVFRQLAELLQLSMQFQAWYLTAWKKMWRNFLKVLL